MAKTTSQSFVASTPRLTLKECVQAVVSIGATRSVLIQGPMGSGKTSMAKMVAEQLGYPLVYFDCVTKEQGDISIPYPVELNDDTRIIKSIWHEELGFHLGRPIVLFFDELGKNRAITNSLMRILRERYGPPPGSIIMAASNLGSEGVGDMILPHIRNGIVMLEMIKPQWEEWLPWAQDNDIEPTLLGAIQECGKTDFFADFRDYADSKENPYIQDPRDPGRTSFVTPRSLHMFSDVLKQRGVNGENITRMMGVGTVGAAAADVLMTQIVSFDSLPRMEDVLKNPKTTPLPKGVGGAIVMANRCIQNTKQESFAAVFEYILRMPKEYQSIYVRQCLSRASLSWTHTMKEFSEYCRTHNHFYKG